MNKKLSLRVHFEVEIIESIAKRARAIAQGTIESINDANHIEPNSDSGIESMCQCVSTSMKLVQSALDKVTALEGLISSIGVIAPRRGEETLMLAKGLNRALAAMDDCVHSAARVAQAFSSVAHGGKHVQLNALSQVRE